MTVQKTPGKFFYSDTLKKRLMDNIDNQFEKYSLNRRELENMKKAELLENTYRIINDLDHLHQIVDEYIEDHIKNNIEYAKSKNYQEKYIEEHKKYINLYEKYQMTLKENETFKNLAFFSESKRKASTGRPKRYGEKEIEIIIQLRKEGKSIRNIASILKMSTATVQKLIKCGNKK